MTIARPLLALLLATGCGFFPGGDPDPAPEVAFAHDEPQSDVWTSGSRGYSGPVVDASSLEAELHGTRLTVAPDRALVRVDLSLEAGARRAVVGRTRDVAGAVAQALTEDGRCEASVARYGTPSRAGEVWSEQATVRLDIPLTDLDDLDARLERVEGCMARFSALGPQLGDVGIQVSAPLPTIDRPEAHRAALLERELRALREVAALDGPEAFDADGMRCVSQGAVTIAERGLHGVALTVDLQCAPRPLPSLAMQTAAPVPHEGAI